MALFRRGCNVLCPDKYPEILKFSYPEILFTVSRPVFFSLIKPPLMYDHVRCLVTGDCGWSGAVVVGDTSADVSSDSVGE